MTGTTGTALPGLTALEGTCQSACSTGFLVTLPTGVTAAASITSPHIC